VRPRFPARLGPRATARLRATRRNSNRRSSAAGPVRTAASVVAVTLVIGIGAYFIGRHDAYPSTQIPLESGEAWVTSNRIGDLTLLDGLAQRPVANVPVASAPGHLLQDAQSGAAAFVVDQDTGTLVRVGDALLTAGPDRIALGDSGANVQIFAGSDVLYAVDGVRGTITLYATDSLQQLGGQILLDRTLGGTSYTAVVDTADRFWLLDAKNGDLVWVDPDGAHGERDGDFAAGHSTLSLADGQPAVTDTAAHSAFLLGPGGSISSAVDIALSAGDQVQASGSPAQSAVLMTSDSRGIYQTCPFSLGHCEPSIDLPTAHDYGPSVEADGRIFIPDYTTGDVWIVDPSDAVGPQPVKVLGPDVQYQLFALNGAVFFNDPWSDRAGTISAGGTVHDILKYTPESPASPAATVAPLPTPKAGSTTRPPVRPSGTPSGTRTGTGATPSAGSTESTESGSPTPTASGGTPSPGAFTILNITVNPARPVAGDSVTISARVSRPPDTWQWTVSRQSTGDTVAASDGAEVSQVYPATGTYLFTLQVTKAGYAPVDYSSTFTVAAAAATISCGQSLTSSATLSQNLNCGATGLIIDADNVTLNLNGHTVSGNGIGAGITLASSAGAVTGVTVENGSVSGFADGLLLGPNGASDTQIDSVRFDSDGADARFDSATNSASGAAIDLGNAVEQDVELSSDVVDQGSSLGEGYVFNSANGGSGTIDITGTTFENGTFNLYTPTWSGEPPTTTMTDDTFIGAPSNLLDVLDSTISQSQFSNSELVNSCDGSSTGFVVSDNTFNHAINALTITDMSNEQVTGNTFQDNRVGIVWYLNLATDRGEAIDGNRFLDNGAAGLLINDKSSTAIMLTINGNTAAGNGADPEGVTDSGGNRVADGIHIYAQTGGITVTRNTTSDNAAYGIWASPGMTTSFGNTSSGNPDGCSPASLCS
jgi:hypothetical protein